MAPIMNAPLKLLFFVIVIMVRSLGSGVVSADEVGDKANIMATNNNVRPENIDQEQKNLAARYLRSRRLCSEWDQPCESDADCCSCCQCITTGTCDYA